MMSPKKVGPDRFSRFDVYLIQTNRQTDKPNLYIEVRIFFCESQDQVQRSYLNLYIGYQDQALKSNDTQHFP